MDHGKAVSEQGAQLVLRRGGMWGEAQTGGTGERKDTGEEGAA